MLTCGHDSVKTFIKLFNKHNLVCKVGCFFINKNQKGQIENCVHLKLIFTAPLSQTVNVLLYLLCDVVQCMGYCQGWRAYRHGCFWGLTACASPHSTSAPNGELSGKLQLVWVCLCCTNGQTSHFMTFSAII